MDQRAIDGLRAQIDELRKRAAWYEELRTATDGGSESMTHEDAVEHVKALAAENNVLREALESIALAGMSGCGQESEEGMRDWHARRAWEFIGIAARALTKESAK
jgi:hypothetical protein